MKRLLAMLALVVSVSALAVGSSASPDTTYQFHFAEKPDESAVVTVTSSDTNQIESYVTAHIIRHGDSESIEFVADAVGHSGQERIELPLP